MTALCLTLPHRAVYYYDIMLRHIWSNYWRHIEIHITNIVKYIIAVWGWISGEVLPVTCWEHVPPSIATMHFSKFSIATNILFKQIPFYLAKQIFRFSKQLFNYVPSLTLSQCTLAGPVYTGMPLVDPVYTGIPLEKLGWNSPTLECHWRNLVESAPHWDKL